MSKSYSFSRSTLSKVNNTTQEISCNDTGACQGSSSVALFFVYCIRWCKIELLDDGTIYESAKIGDLPHFHLK